ncbi:hypothetical protein HPP92_012026 [Vanilla planifolia]|uniref:Receptor ligand binding region domain-containing protein n=1 Tax=Vanilla planifolia TaxID=51239 RepID=A0A835RDH7_VANPL|nr:hypothetical protein HPP92_012026 [Vanilla planifolia]
MMSEGYAWIRTYGTTDYLHLMDPMAIDAMQGVVSVNPYVAASNRLGEFKAKWKNKFYVKKNTSSLQLDQPGIFGLWAYDAVWSLATAAESVHNTWNQSTPVSEGAKLLDSLLKGASNLGGGVMSGNFYISGSLERVKFEIVNVIGSYKKRVGFWTLAHGISRSLNHKAPLYDILWPGDSMRTPNTLERKGGLKRKTGQKKLRIGIPVQQEFHELVNYEWNPFSSRNGNGFSINVFDMVMASLPYNVDYEYIPYMNGNGRMKGTYDDIIHEVYLQHIRKDMKMEDNVLLEQHN